MLLSTTILNQSQASSASSSLNPIFIKDFLQLTFSAALRLLQRGVPVADDVLCFLSAFTEAGE